MNTYETAQMWGYVRTLWPNSRPMDDDQVLALADLFVDVGAAEARAALTARSVRGDAFAPAPGQIIADVREALNPATTWPQALRTLRRACSRFSPDDPDRALEWLRNEDASVASWAEEYGWFRFSMEPIDNVIHGTRVAARLAESFGAHAPRSAQRQAISSASTAARPQIGGH